MASGTTMITIMTVKSFPSQWYRDQLMSTNWWIMMNNYMSQLIHSGKGPGVRWIAKSLSMLTEIKKFGNSISLSYNFEIYWLISLKILWQSMVAQGGAWRAGWKLTAQMLVTVRRSWPWTWHDTWPSQHGGQLARTTEPAADPGILLTVWYWIWIVDETKI